MPPFSPRRRVSPGPREQRVVTGTGPEPRPAFNDRVPGASGAADDA